MKSSVEIPDGLFREAKATAARNGTKLKDLVADGLRLVLTQAKPERSRLQFPLIPHRKGSPRLTAAEVNKIIETEDLEQDAAKVSTHQLRNFFGATFEKRTILKLRQSRQHTHPGAQP